jgi:ATP adenylyltransferase
MLCGTTRDESLLDVDHIKPRSRGGKTIYENLQVLCAKCNRSKSNKDDTDFRHITDQALDSSCTFCRVQKEDYMHENDYAFTRLDKYPVTKGHTLIIPKRHFADYFDITKVEQDAINALLRLRRTQLLEEDKKIEGFNIGVNVGEAAGQTIFHCHLHLIPRRKGDHEAPRGGVRGVIPQKMKY